MSKIRQSELTATAACVARGGVDADGVILSAATIRERVGWLIGLSNQIASTIVADHWTTESLNVLDAGVGPDGRELPSQGAVALRRLGWGHPPDELYIPDRVVRAGREHGARLLRGGLHRGTVTNVVLQSWPENPNKRTRDDWSALEAREKELGVELSRPEIRNRTRAVAAFLHRHDRLPVDVVELEDPPRVAPEIPLAPADKQLVTLTRVGSKAVVRIKLPLTDTPKTRADWEWVWLHVTLGGHVPVEAVLHIPTLRLSGKHVRVDMPWTVTRPEPLARTGKKHAGHRKSLNGDWGVNTLLTAVTATIDDTRAAHPIVRTDGRCYTFDGQGVALKLHRLRQQTETLTAKIAHLDTLLAGLPSDAADLFARRDVLSAERDRVSAKRTNLNRELAWAAATWLVDLAVATGATVIYMEDLRTMESRGIGKKQNVRASNQVRGIVLSALRHQAAKHGITVVTVPARGTSSMCPKCLAPHKHVPAPDRAIESGHSWSVCGACGNTDNRDMAAAQRIATRGLAAQHKAHLDSNRHWRITATVDVPIRVTRTNRRQHHNQMRIYTRPTYSRDKRDATPGRTPSRSSVPATTRAIRVPLRVVHRPAGTSPSLDEPSNTSQQTGHTFILGPRASTPTKQQRRRAQSRGFHPLTHPTWVPRAEHSSPPVPNKT